MFRFSQLLKKNYFGGIKFLNPGVYLDIVFNRLIAALMNMSIPQMSINNVIDNKPGKNDKDKRVN